MHDSAWFFSSLAQVSAGLVGLIGGFVVLRLHDQIGRWQELRTDILLLQSRWVNLDQMNPGRPLVREFERERALAWNEFMIAYARGQQAKMPGDLVLALPILFLIFVVGALVPLARLDAPSTGERAVMLATVAGLILVFGTVLLAAGRRAMRQVRAPVLLPQTTDQLKSLEVAVQEGRAPGVVLDAL